MAKLLNCLQFLRSVASSSLFLVVDGQLDKGVDDREGAFHVLAKLEIVEYHFVRQANLLREDLMLNGKEEADLSRKWDEQTTTPSMGKLN